MPRPRLPLPAGPAFALALALAPAVGAQLPPGSPVSWLPPAPTAGDLVVVSVSGAWRDSCVPALAEIHRDPDPADFPALYPPLEPPLAIASRWALVLEAAGEGCFSAVSPFHVDVALGPLPPGHNRVLVQVHDTFVTPPEDTLLDIVDIPVGGSPETLLLHDGRFAATVSWRDHRGRAGEGLAVPGASRSSGLFRFFAPHNWEILVKVLDGCSLNGHFWVFLAAATDVEYTVRVEDGVTGSEWERTNPLGELSRARADLQALGPCTLP